MDHAELREILGGSKGVVIMCPDSDNIAVKEALDVAFSEMSPKKHKVAIAESFGGNDEPVDKLSTDLIALGLDPVFALRVKHDPTEQVCKFTTQPTSWLPCMHAVFSEQRSARGAIAESSGGDDEPVDKQNTDLIALGLGPVFALRVKQGSTEQVCDVNAKPCVLRPRARVESP